MNLHGKKAGFSGEGIGEEGPNDPSVGHEEKGVPLAGEEALVSRKDLSQKVAIALSPQEAILKVSWTESLAKGPLRIRKVLKPSGTDLLKLRPHLHRDRPAFQHQGQGLLRAAEAGVHGEVQGDLPEQDPHRPRLSPAPLREPHPLRGDGPPLREVVHLPVAQEEKPPSHG